MIFILPIVGLQISFCLVQFDFLDDLIADAYSHDFATYFRKTWCHGN